MSGLGQVEALLFDVFGTVVNWEQSVSSQLEDLAQSTGITENVDWVAFTRKWRAGYLRSTRAIALGEEIGPTNVDALHLHLLRSQLSEPAYSSISSVWAHDDSILDRAVKFWHRLAGWPDSSSGLKQLRANGFIIGTLSNGSLSLQIDLVKFADLPYHVLFSGDMFDSYKPNPEMYLKACKLLGFEGQVEKVCMVASHVDDVRKARELGLRTVYIIRDTEDARVDKALLKTVEQGGEFDGIVKDFEELSKLMVSHKK